MLFKDRNPVLMYEMAAVPLLCCFQFSSASRPYEDMLKWLNIIFTALFTLECILKIIAFGLLVRNT